MQNAGQQFGQGGAPSHQSVPFGHSENTTTGGSITSSLRQFRKRNDDKQPLGDAPTPVAESHVARVAPHNHYPPASRPTAVECYRFPTTQQYQDFGVHSQVKYSEISEGQPMQDHVSPTVIQKVKGKEYMEMCNVTQPHMKQPYDIINQQPYHETNVHPHAQYIPKEQPVNPAYKPESQYFPKEPPPAQQYQPHHAPPPPHHSQQQPPPQQKYAMPPSHQQPKYSPHGNDFLSKLRRINPSMARSIMSDHHLQESQMAYQSMDQRGMYAAQNQRYSPGYVNYPTMQNNPYGPVYMPPSHPSAAYANYPPSCSYARAPQMAPRYPHDRDASPRRGYQEGAAPMPVGYGAMAAPQKMSPGYHQYGAPEYAQHYQHRRGVAPVAQDYYQHYRPSQYHPHQMNAQEMPEARATVSDSIKQYIENWADEDTASELNQLENGRLCKDGTRMRPEDPSNETVYMINASDIQYLENGIPVVTSESGIPMMSENAQYIIKGIDSASGMVRIIGKNGQMEIGEIVDHIKPDCMLANKPNELNQRHPNENPYGLAEKPRVVVHQNTVIQSSYHTQNIAFPEKPADHVKVGNSLPIITDTLDELNRRIVKESKKETVDKNCSPINIEQMEGYSHPSVICPNKALEEELAKIQESSSSEDSMRSMPFIDPFADNSDSKMNIETIMDQEDIPEINDDNGETKVQEDAEVESITKEDTDSDEDSTNDTSVIDEDDNNNKPESNQEETGPESPEDAKTETVAITDHEDCTDTAKIAETIGSTEQIGMDNLDLEVKEQNNDAMFEQHEAAEIEPNEICHGVSDDPILQQDGVCEKITEVNAEKPDQEQIDETSITIPNVPLENETRPIEKSTARRSRRIFSVDDIMYTIGNNINKHENESLERRHSLQTTEELVDLNIQHTFKQYSEGIAKNCTLGTQERSLEEVKEIDEETITSPTELTKEQPSAEIRSLVAESKADEEEITEDQNSQSLQSAVSEVEQQGEETELITEVVEGMEEQVVNRLAIEETMSDQTTSAELREEQRVDEEDLTNTKETMITRDVEPCILETIVDQDEKISLETETIEKYTIEEHGNDAVPIEAIICSTENSELIAEIVIEETSCSIKSSDLLMDNKEELVETESFMSPTGISTTEQEQPISLEEQDLLEDTSETEIAQKDNNVVSAPDEQSREPAEQPKEPIQQLKKLVAQSKERIELPKQPLEPAKVSVEDSSSQVWEERLISSAANEIQYQHVVRVEESSVLLHIAGELVEITVNTVNGKKVITVVPLSDTSVVDLNDNYENVENLDRNDPLRMDDHVTESNDNISEVANYQVVAPEPEIVETTSEIIIGMDLSLEEEIKLDVDQPPVICTKAARKCYDTDLQIPSITTSDDINETSRSPIHCVNDKVSSTKERIEKVRKERKDRIEKITNSLCKDDSSTKPAYPKRLNSKNDKKSLFKNLIHARNLKKAKQEQKDVDDDFVPFKDLVRARKLKKLKMQELKKSQDGKIDSTIKIDEIKKENNSEASESLKKDASEKSEPVEENETINETDISIFKDVSMGEINEYLEKELISTKSAPIGGQETISEPEVRMFKEVSMNDTNCESVDLVVELEKIDYIIDDEKDTNTAEAPSTVLTVNQETPTNTKEVVKTEVSSTPNGSKKVKEIRNYKLEDPRLKERPDGNKPKYPEPKKKLSLEEYNRRKRKLVVQETQDNEVQSKKLALDTTLSSSPELIKKPTIPKRIRSQRPKSLDDLNLMKPKENTVLSRKLSLGSAPSKPNSFDWEDTQSPKSNVMQNCHDQRFSEFSGLINDKQIIQSKPVIDVHKPATSMDGTLQNYKDQVESKLSSLNIQIPIVIKPADKLPLNPWTEPETNILMQKFLKSKKLTSEEIEKIKKIISYKRLMQQMKHLKPPEVTTAPANPTYEIKKELGEAETKLHLKKVEKKRKFRCHNLSNSESEEEDFRDRRSGDYSVVQANCLAGVVPKLIIKRKMDMPLPIVRLERLDLDRLADNKVRYVV